MKVQVLGAGCWGLAAAVALARRGHDVAVHDPRGVGNGATSKAAGIVSTMLADDRDARLVMETRDALIRMQDGLAHPAYRPCKSFVVADDATAAFQDALAGRAARLGVHASFVDKVQGLHVKKGERVLAVQGDGVVEAGDLVALLQREAKRSCAKLQERHTNPEALVVAAGAWTPKVLAGFGVRLPVLGYRTQLASLRMAGAEQLPIVHDLTGGWYLRPGGHGEFLAGNGTQLRPFDPDDYNEAADPEFLEKTAGRVVGRIAGGENASIAAGWAGVLAGTPDRRPIIGPIPDRPELFVMTGDNGTGVMRCVALGERLADVVDGEQHNDLALERFGWPPPATFELREGFAA